MLVRRLQNIEKSYSVLDGIDTLTAHQRFLDNAIKDMAKVAYLPPKDSVHILEYAEAVKGRRSLAPIDAGVIQAMDAFEEKCKKAKKPGLYENHSPYALRLNIAYLCAGIGSNPPLIPKNGQEFTLKYNFYVAMAIDPGNITGWGDHPPTLKTPFDKNPYLLAVVPLIAESEDQLIKMGYDSKAKDHVRAKAICLENSRLVHKNIHYCDQYSNKSDEFRSKVLYYISTFHSAAEYFTNICRRITSRISSLGDHCSQKFQEFMTHCYRRYFFIPTVDWYTQADFTLFGLTDHYAKYKEFQVGIAAYKVLEKEHVKRMKKYSSTFDKG